MLIRFRKQRFSIKFLFTYCVILMSCRTLPFATLTTSDPYPLYTTLDPQTYLYTHDKTILKGLTPQTRHSPLIGISITPFGINADKAKGPCGGEIEIGDLDGRWSMVPLLFGSVPQGQILPPTLQAARAALFPGVVGPIEDATAIDPNQLVGFFSVPIEYRKRGLRIQLETQITCNLGLSLQTGFSEISQCANFLDLTDSNTFACSNANLTQCNVEDYLMYPLKQIANEIGLNIDNFLKLSIEDIRLGAYWRHAHVVNRHNLDYPEFLCIPFLAVNGSFATGKPKPGSQAFAVPFGNNGHNAIGGKGGINLDFVETIEIGGEVGFTHFFQKSFDNYRIPTSEYQQGIYPFSTSACVQPGMTWFMGAKMNAYHFLHHLSFWAEYMYIDHRRDCLTLKCPDPAFDPEYPTKRTSWKVQQLTTAFNYDISPNMSLGFLWQAPTAQRNAYRASTLLFSFSATW